MYQHQETTTTTQALARALLGAEAGPSVAEDEVPHFGMDLEFDYALEILRCEDCGSALADDGECAGCETIEADVRDELAEVFPMWSTPLYRPAGDPRAILV